MALRPLHGALLAWRSFGFALFWLDALLECALSSALFWNASFRRRPFVGALLAGALMRIPERCDQGVSELGGLPENEGA